MILSFQEIDAAIRNGQIVIEPRPDEAAWTSTAIDLTLNNVLLERKPPKSPPTGGDVQWPRPKAKNFNVQAMMDDSNLARRVEIDQAQGYELKPRSFVLGFTREIVQLPIQSRRGSRAKAAWPASASEFTSPPRQSTRVSDSIPPNPINGER